MSLEDTLAGWTGPSSETEKDKQDRTERMVREAIQEHEGLADCNITVYAKGSYANNTNVRTDSDVDVAVQCHDVFYWGEESAGAHGTITPYQGMWTPAKLRGEIGAALRAKFLGQVDESGSTAFRVSSNSARVDGDVVPCFDYRYYFASGGSREGTKIFPKTGAGFENYPAQQLAMGNAKNDRTRTFHKKAVRILKRVENAMFDAGQHRAVPSFFVECLVYNCPDHVLLASTWTDTIRQILVHIWNGLDGAEPSEPQARWLEVSECKYLFHPGQAWTRADGRDFAKAAWNHLGYTS